MAAADKDTIYVDIDDEITGIIDKLKSSNGKIVALVLPKRASVFQSIVNMKLLKRAADESKKHLVLITSEAGLLPLAGLAGVLVAKTLTSKPEVPAGPMLDSDAEETIDEDNGQLAGDELPEDAAEQPVGKLAGIGAASSVGADGVETLMLDDDEAPENLDDLADAGPKTFAPPKTKKNKKLAVPNFEKFRLLLVLAVLAGILLIGGLVYAFTALPKATINIKTDASNIDTNLNLNLSTAAKTLKPSTSTVPAKLATQQKSNTQQVTTTGQKNNGNKASGEVTMTAQVCGSIPVDSPPAVPAGTGVSSNGLTFITQENTVFSDTAKAKGGCLNYSATNATTIIAQNGGSSYNSANSFAVAGRKDVSVTVSSAISGGTDNITQVVSATDISNVKAKLVAADANLKSALQTELKQQGYRAIDATYLAGTAAVTTSASPGDAASTVTATSTVTYTMFGVHDSDLKTLVEDSIKKEIDTSKQSILDNGLSKAAFTVTAQTTTDAQVNLVATATAGPDLDVKQIKADAVGKKGADIRASLQNNPDVKSVDVKLSPFWVNSVPNKQERIFVNIAKPTSTKPSSKNVDNP